MNKPVVVMGTVITVLQVISGGVAALEILPDKAVGLILLGTAALTAGWTYYTHQQVTPLADPKDKDGTPLVPER
jgi:hypothetical protein